MTKIFVSGLFLFLLTSFSNAANFDINLSKNTIYVGDIFSGKSINVYGLLEKNNYDYVILTYLDEVAYEIKPRIKNRFGLVKTSNKTEKVKYYGFLDIRSTTKNYTRFLKYKTNPALDYDLTSKDLMNISTEGIKIKENGLFGEKINIPKTAKTGKYIAKVYVLDKKNGEIKAIFTEYFNVVLSGDGAFVKKLAKNEKTIYTILSIAITIGISCLVAFLLDFYKSLTNRN